MGSTSTPHQPNHPGIFVSITSLFLSVLRFPLQSVLAALPFIIVVLGFVTFVTWNGGIALGMFILHSVFFVFLIYCSNYKQVIRQLMLLLFIFLSYFTFRYLLCLSLGPWLSLQIYHYVFFTRISRLYSLLLESMLNSGRLYTQSDRRSCAVSLPLSSLQQWDLLCTIIPTFTRTC